MKLARYAKFDCFPFQKYMFSGLEMGFSYVLQYKVCSLHLLELSGHLRMRSKNHGTHFSGSRTSGYISILCRHGVGLLVEYLFCDPVHTLQFAAIF